MEAKTNGERELGLYFRVCLKASDARCENIQIMKKPVSEDPVFGELGSQLSPSPHFVTTYRLRYSREFLPKACDATTGSNYNRRRQR
jgi:hypothetical protein